MVNGSKRAGPTDEGVVSRGGTRSPLDLPREVDRLAVQQATVEAREALEAVVVATHRALSYARQLDAALAGVDQIVGSGELESGGQVLPATNRLGRSEEVLSPREQEVLALIAEGRSNKAIAEALYVSPNTVKTHVASLLTKLRADSRVQLAAIATRQDLHRRAANAVSSDLVPLARSRSRR